MISENTGIEEIISDVAIYARKSRGDTEEDLIKHKMLMIETCKKYGWRHVMYEEIGSGDTIESRPKMRELLKDLDDDLFDAVVVVDFDRLGRGDEEDQGIIKKTLLRNEVFVVECSPFRILNLYDDNDLQVVEFKGFLARQEYKMITKRLLRGKKLGSKLGNWTNGIAPFPYEYNKDKKGLVINEEKYKMYRSWINKLFNGWSSNQIADELNAMNYPTPRSHFPRQRNAKWHGNTIINILTSEVHLGKIIVNKSRYNKYKKKRIENPKEEWIVIENCHEPCKTEEEHKQILSIIYQNRKDKAKRKEIYNKYTGLIKCYNCGETLSIQKRQNGNYSVRKCTKCQLKGGDISFLEQLLLDTVKKFYSQIDDIVDELQNQNDLLDLESKISQIETDIKKKEVELKRVQEGFIHGLWDIEETKILSKPIKNEIEFLLIKKEEIQEKINTLPTIDVEKLKDIYAEIMDKLNTVENEKEKNELFKILVESVYWYRNNDAMKLYVELKQSLD